MNKKNLYNILINIIGVYLAIMTPIHVISEEKPQPHRCIKTKDKDTHLTILLHSLTKYVKENKEKIICFTGYQDQNQLITTITPTMTKTYFFGDSTGTF
jgi:hypothetical protein